MRKLKVGDVLKRVKNTTTLDDNQRYKRVTIKMNHKGVSIRDIELGINIGTKSQFFIREGQFLLSKIDARNGAFGIVPPEADGAIITGNFWAFDVNQKELNIDLFHIMTSLPFFDELSKKASSGTTNRQYLDEKKFLTQEITLPPIEEQDVFITHFKKIQIAHRNTRAELKTQSTLIAKLRSSILSDAVSGRLVPQDSTDEPASMLLERIKAEKERLLKEGKLKRDKPLSPISADEIPYELPDGWVWCRLGTLFNVKSSKRIFESDYRKSGIPFYRSMEIGLLSQNLPIFSDIFISEDYFKEIQAQYGVPSSGDILLACIGGSIGNTWMVDDREFYYKDGNLVCIEQSKAVNVTYLLYYLKSSLFFDYALNKVSGSAYNALTIIKINHSLFPLPPLTEQHRIVANIEKLMNTCDALEAEVAKSRMETDRLMQTILKEAFEERNETDV